MDPGFAASEIDTTTPHPARMYDALLGGKDHYRADQDAVRQVLKAAPEARDSALANRAFLQRAVRFVVGEAGIRQIIDIGTGVPAAGNVHQVAGEIAPDTRVVYVDNDPIVHVHANALLTGSGATSIRAGCLPSRHWSAREYRLWGRTPGRHDVSGYRERLVADVGWGGARETAVGEPAGNGDGDCDRAEHPGAGGDPDDQAR